MWGDSVPPLRTGPRGDDLAERERRRQRARLSSRDPLPHRALDRQPGGPRRERLARRGLQARGRAARSRMFLEDDGDGERLARRPRASAPSAAVRVAVLKVGALRGRRAGRLRPHRRARRRPAGLPGPGRGGRRRLGADPHELLELARVACRAAARDRAAAAGSRSSPARAATRASPPTRRSWSAPSCPRFRSATRERLAELLPDAATIGNPLDYTAMIWGDTDLLRRIAVTVGDDPAIDQLLVLYDHPQGLAPEAAADLGRGPRRDRRRRRRDEGRRPWSPRPSPT